MTDADARTNEACLKFAGEVLKNPVVELLLLTAALEKLHANGVIGLPLMTVVGTVGGTAIVAQQVAPLMPYAADFAKSLIPGITSALPLLAAGA